MSVVGRVRRTDAEAGYTHVAHRDSLSRGTRTRLVALAAALIVTVGGLVAAAEGQVSSDDRRCITTFSKSLRLVGKRHGKIIKKCLTRFSSGSLTQLPEVCIADDPGQKLLTAVEKGIAKTDAKCTVTPAFGTSLISTALTRSIIAQFDQVHGSVAADLDTGLIPDKDDASCQAKVYSSVLKCSDTRIKEYLKCENKGLKDGTITDATTLSATCLGSGMASQADPKGKIASKCGTKLLSTVNRHCADTDLLQAFVPCSSADANSLVSCLSSETACQLCRLLNDVGGVVRDCDAFDDGDDTNGSCSAECSDGLVHPDEGCDDGNGVAGDGCSDFCQVEGGWTCTGEPSVCTLNCGNGAIDPGEACDDGATVGGDGCSSTCLVESGYECSGSPSSCHLICGNGALDAGEACDDGNTIDGDGCTSACTVEPAYLCTGSPSVCIFECGNGTFQAGETCDDNDAVGGDGCSSICQIEPGWLCSGQPSLCSPVCGDGLIRGPEPCDDGNVDSGDGCSFSCQIETGYTCASEPSSCSAVCGDGFIRGLETCDDVNTISGDGCSGDLCRQEFDHLCTGQPSVCVALCGDGNLDGIEECDDGGLANGDGCAGNCTTEPGFACFGEPSLCAATCGNSALDPGEECDDGNALGGDGCGFSCLNESGWLCGAPGTACNQFGIFIDSPAHGVFTTASSIVVSGSYTLLSAGQAQVLINGSPPDTIDTVARTFSHTVALSAPAIFNPVVAELTNLSNGDDVRSRIVVIRGESVADGAFSPQSVALRLNDSGLDSIEPLVGGLAAGQFNLAELVPVGTVITDSCFIDSFLGCLGSARVTIANPPPSFSSLGLTIDSQVNSVFGDVQINGLVIDVNINGSGLVPDCGLRMTASAMNLTGNYTLEPDASDPTSIDVNLSGATGVSFSGFNTNFTSGLCDAPIIGDIIQSLLPDVQQLALDGITGFVDDPDGAGPQDSPIAAGIQTVLAGISITGPVGEGLGLQLDAPLFAVTEDNDGVTLGSDSRFLVDIGTGPGQCVPPVGAPDFSASYSVSDPFPPFAATTPVSGQPYGLGICISAAGFNQLLRGQTECGLMRSSISEIDLDGPGPGPPLTINSTLLSALVPEFGQLPPATPLRIDIAPTLAPIVTGNTGPGGELTELQIAQLTLDIVEPGPETIWLRGAMDLPIGMDLSFNGQGLGITLGTVLPQDIVIEIVRNPLGVDEAALANVLPGVITPLIPDLAGALSGFPLPAFFGLELDGVDVSKNGQFLSLFANLNATP